MKMDTHIDTLLQELTDIVGEYKKDLVSKEALNDHIHALSVYVAIESRTEEEKEAIKRKSQENPSREMIEQILLEYISADQYMEIYRKTALSVIQYYVTNMIPTMPDDIQNKLKKYLERLGSIVEFD